MNVSLTPELENFVKQEVETGMYQTASEVIRDGLRLLQERREDRTVRLERLRGEIAEAAEQLDRGQGIPSEEVFRELRERNRKAREKTK